MPDQDDEPPQDDYEVGYGRPPPEHRFKKGSSGNPRGRPKKSRNLTTILREIAAEQVTVREGERTRRLSKLEVLVHSLVNKAMKGDPRAMTILTPLLGRGGLLDDVASAEVAKLSDAEEDIFQKLLRTGRDREPGESDEIGT